MNCMQLCQLAKHHINDNTLMQYCQKHNSCSEKTICESYTFGDNIQIVLDDNNICAHIVVRTHKPQEIHHLFVLPEYRRLGIAQRLLSKAQTTSDELLLEVAENNLVAQALYIKNGFWIYSKREHYYQSSGEHALCMRWQIKLTK